jgi:hypothetical protein
VWGGWNVVIGLAVPFVVRYLRTDILVISARTDAIVFGAPPKEILMREPALDTFRTLIWQWLGGPLVAFGLVAIAVAWFGLRNGEAWALIVLALAWAATLSAALVLERYVRKRAPLGVRDIPPLFTIPATIGTLAIVLSWIGLAQRAPFR